MNWVKCSDQTPPINERLLIVCISNHISEFILLIGKDAFGNDRYRLDGYGAEKCCSKEYLIYTAQYWMVIPKIPTQIKIKGTSL